MEDLFRKRIIVKNNEVIESEVIILRSGMGTNSSHKMQDNSVFGPCHAMCNTKCKLLQYGKIEGKRGIGHMKIWIT